MSDSHDEHTYQQWLAQRRQPRDIDVSDAVVAKLELETQAADVTDAPVNRDLSPSSGKTYWLAACARFARLAAIAGAILIGIVRLSWFLLPMAELR